MGPRAQRVYQALSERIVGLSPGTQLPTLAALAEEFGVAPLTVRQALATLEEQGYLSREQGRGAFVRERTAPSVLVVEDDTPIRTLLVAHLTRLGYHAVEATNPEAGLAALKGDLAIALVISDVRMLTPREGIAFIRAVRHRWPSLPFVAVTGYPDDLAPLHGTSDCPVLIMAKPIWARHVEEALRLTMGAQPLATTWPVVRGEAGRA